MAWLNTAYEILKEKTLIREKQSFSYFANEEGQQVIKTMSRSRDIVHQNVLYVGMNQAAAEAKQSELADDPTYQDVKLIRADDSGQYHVSATKVTVGNWSDWSEI